jgi:hypothetical protein
MYISAQTFALAVVIGSITLAVWLAVRFPNAGPSKVGYALLHLLAGFAAIRAIPGLMDAGSGLTIQGKAFVLVFGIALPLLTYTFLTGLWVMRLLHSSLRGPLHK